jgi:two-component system, LuxR family, sensor kinase FixL
MSVVTIVWSMIAGACCTLAAAHLPVWWRNRESGASFAFAMAAICTAGLSFCELAMLHAQTATAYAAGLRWAHLTVTLLLLSLAAFTHLYLRAGRPWLAVAALGLRLISTPFNLMNGDNLNFRRLTGLRSTRFLGEGVSIPLGDPNPWMLMSQLGVLLLIVFVADATATAWRRGDREMTLGVGLSISFFLLAGMVQFILVLWGGVEFPMTVSLFALGLIGVMGYALSLDLAHAKQMVIELREREQEAALTADTANLGIWVHDIARDVIWGSDKWRELFGFASSEKLTTDRVLQRIHADDREAFGSRMTHMADDLPDYHAEYRVVLPDGKLRWIAHQGRVELDARRRPVRTRGVSIDITSRKHAEREMLRLQQEIAHVGRVSVMGQLASALAHEINQPLGAILRNAEAAALFMQDPSPDLAEISAIVEDIRKDDQRAGAVIDRMRALLRHQEVEMVPVDVGQMLGDVATLLRPDAAARHVKLSLDVPDGVPAVRGDRVQLQQVLLNLVLNGMDALDGVTGDEAKVSVTARIATADTVEISVRDTGRGVPADKLERIFDPFFSTKSKGIGMGLSISRSIIDAHGGRLWAENNVHGGATFRFTLPVASDGDTIDARR